MLRVILMYSLVLVVPSPNPQLIGNRTNQVEINLSPDPQTILQLC